MLLFWRQGYEATSIRDLIGAMGISSSSMYEVFGDKRGIFLAALARYCEIERESIAQMAAGAPTPYQFIENLFASVETVVHTDSGTHNGSLVFNTMVELTKSGDRTDDKGLVYRINILTSEGHLLELVVDAATGETIGLGGQGFK